MGGWIAGGLEELDVWCQGLVGFWVCGGYVCMCVHVGGTPGQSLNLDFHSQGKHDDYWPQFCFRRTLWTNIFRLRYTDTSVPPQPPCPDIIHLENSY